MWINIIASVIVIAILGGAVAYIVRSKKKGKVCIGCPYADQCAMRRQNCSCTAKQAGASQDESKTTK